MEAAIGGNASLADGPGLIPRIIKLRVPFVFQFLNRIGYGVDGGIVGINAIAWGDSAPAPHILITSDIHLIASDCCFGTAPCVCLNGSGAVRTSRSRCDGGAN